MCYYSFRYGAIAQLGERLHGMQEAAGSTPVGSIKVCPDRLSGHHLSKNRRPEGRANATSCSIFFSHKVIKLLKNGCAPK